MADQSSILGATVQGAKGLISWLGRPLGPVRKRSSGHQPLADIALAQPRAPKVPTEALSLPDGEIIDWAMAAENGAQLLDDVVAFILRYVALPDKQADAAALWVIHSHALDAFDATPYLAITSAEKRSGKTRLLEVLELLVARPWLTGRVTTAVLARKVDKECPTLLLDESDSAFKAGKVYAEELRGILNTGHRRGGKASVCVGQGAFRDFSTFCAKAIAGIGKLPDTVADRSITLHLKRRAPHEHVERFRARDARAAAAPLLVGLAQWAAGSVSILREARPDIPSELDDRAADSWEPLLAIAELVGGNWQHRARKAAVAISAGEAREDDSLGVQLLADIADVIGDCDKITTSELLNGLRAIGTAPWRVFGQKEKPLDARRLAALLRPYGIKPITFRVCKSTPKGYERHAFEDAWARYTPRLSATSR